MKIGGISSSRGIEFISKKHQSFVPTKPDYKVFVNDLNEPVYLQKSSILSKYFIIMLLLLYDLLSYLDIIHNRIRSLQYEMPTVEVTKYNSIYIKYVGYGLIILSIFYFYLKYIQPALINLKRNHAAEHKAIAAFNHNDLDNIKNYSRFSHRCGGNLLMPFLMIFSLDFIDYRLPLGSFAILFIIVWSKHSIVRKIIFVMFGKWTQYLTTKEPTDDILKRAKEGIEVLIISERDE